MKKVALFISFLAVTCMSFAQSYFNEWVDYKKTYYKFKVGATGLYRISKTDLDRIGLSNTAAENFQLWRNGKEITLYTSSTAGPLPADGYIEFWSVRNDGVPDRNLYRVAGYQLSDRESLLTDTAAFFLTVNSQSANQRFVNTDNNVAGTTLIPEPYFLYTLHQGFREQINKGAAEIVGEYLYSSSYDIGEMWSTNDINITQPYTVTLNTPGVVSSGPGASLKIAVAGSSPYFRNYRVEINNAVLKDTTLNSFEARVDNAAVPLSLLAQPNTTLKVTNKGPNANDRMVAGFVDITYPRSFNFNNQSSFPFTLQPLGSARLLQVSNFNAGGATPVLYDLTSGRRYVANVAGDGTFKFVILPATLQQDFVLVSQSVSAVLPVNQFLQRNFVDYKTTANQGNYLVISHSSLQVPYSGKDQVTEYVNYRKSASGGSYVARAYDIDELVDQFGYGIKKNPLGIKNFLRYARTNFPYATQYAFLIGKGLSYDEYRQNEANPQADRLNLIPTFGYPASDVLLASNNMDPVLNTFIGRLSVLYPQEVADYLDKIKAYEQAQANTAATIADKAWMKNFVHVVGGGDAGLDQRLTAFMKNYENIIEDTLYGGIVSNFNKLTTGPVTPITNTEMADLFQQGISFITYFGHSSATSFDYNLDDPSNYNNTGKYPVFCALGCNAGNFYTFDTARFFSVNSTLSEKYVLAKQKGTIGFIASTHFGVDSYLDTYTRALYRSMGVTAYGKPVSQNIADAVKSIIATYGIDNRLARLHAEENTLHGDPALKVNSSALPDFVVEEPQIKISPNIVSVADTKFTVKAYLYNIGKATGDSVLVTIRHRYPGGTDSIIYNAKIRSVRFSDSIMLDVPIVSSRDKGENKITVSVDGDNAYTESSETNNTATVTFIIQSDELRPVFPYNFSIINVNNLKPVASTAEPVGTSKNYVFEMDTTALFNSSQKITRNAASTGGILEFDPGIIYTDSTVYYWRVAPIPANGAYVWNDASFVYLKGTENGFNQSHFFQHTNSATSNISIDSTSRKWTFGTSPNQVTIVNSIYPVSGTEDNQFSVAVNGDIFATSACVGHSVIFNVLDPVTLKPLFNQDVPSVVKSGNAGGFMGSAAICQNTKQYNFEFSYLDTTGRRKMRDFMNWIPAGYYVTVRLIFDEPFDQNPLVDAWKNDAAIYGAGNTAYDKFKAVGFTDFDAFTFPRTWAFMYQKNNTTFQTQSKLSNDLLDRITLNVPVNLTDTTGTIVSPQFGPATAWKKVIWRGSPAEVNSADVVSVNVVGITPAGQADTLYRLNSSQQDFDISTINATQYPYLRLSMYNTDGKNMTPYQLRYWRVYYSAVPEGALAANLSYKFKDTLETGEAFNFSMAFKNISNTAFSDSLLTNLVVYNKNNVETAIPVNRNKKLLAGDTAQITALIDTKNLAGNNTFFIDVNPNSAQPEQYHFNNVMYRNFFVKTDTYNPLLDVTFDGVHILNGDIVSARPKVMIKLKDESKFLALDDTSLTAVYVRYPDANGTTVRYAFGTDTLRFIPADLSTGKNEATIEFSPAFLQDSDGDNYELIVKAKDKSGNTAGAIEYRVRFQVYNKPMISNMFNYPNPFTTSTAFVFTITGSQVPQNIRIQIMTITGKIVREITTQELGPLHIGRNITDYKWDGADQYGQKLANGVYLYRVLTNLNGASLGKFNTLDANGDKVDTDKFFNKGYGKMYLMR